MAGLSRARVLINHPITLCTTPQDALVVFQQRLDRRTESGHGGKIVPGSVIPEKPSPGTDQDDLLPGLKEGHDKIAFQTVLARPRVVVAYNFPC